MKKKKKRVYEYNHVGKWDVDLTKLPLPKSATYRKPILKNEK